MPKVSLLEDSDKEESWCFYCPGCKCSHYFRVRRSNLTDPLWTWNKDVEHPTVRPSIDCMRSDPTRRCHLFIENGMIRYLDDCHHHLKGSIIPMEEDD